MHSVSRKSKAKCTFKELGESWKFLIYPPQQNLGYDILYWLSVFLELSYMPKSGMV
jgi:hypothetical protein